MQKPEEPYITLGDFMRVEGLAENGGHAKALIQGGRVKVNGEIDTRRGRKLRQGDRVQLDEEEEKLVGELRR
jgi:ribosome-associated protein